MYAFIRVCVLRTKFSNRVDQLQKEISPLIPMRSSLQGQKFIYNTHKNIAYSKFRRIDEGYDEGTSKD